MDENKVVLFVEERWAYLALLEFVTSNFSAERNVHLSKMAPATRSHL